MIDSTTTITVNQTTEYIIMIEFTICLIIINSDTVQIEHIKQ